MPTKDPKRLREQRQRSYEKTKDARRPALRASRKASQQTKREVFDALKRHPCMDCGGSYPPCVMDWDHRDGEVKLFNIASLKASVEDMLIEIAKCDLVCANCHRVRTARRAGWPESRWNLGRA